jgi:hypothetical protein
MSATNDIVPTTLDGLPYVTVRDAAGRVYTVPLTAALAAAILRADSGREQG